VLVPHSCQPIGFVRPGVLLVADPDQGRFEQADDGGEHLLPWQARPPQIGVDPAPDGGQGLGEGDQPAVLRLVPHLAPARVIAVLLAALVVAAGRLQVAAWVGVDPDIGVGGRNCQSVDPVTLLLIADRRAVRREVGPAASGAPPLNARSVVRGIDEAGGFGVGDRVVRLCHGLAAV
jgi:hypothetical protein